MGSKQIHEYNAQTTLNSTDWHIIQQTDDVTKKVAQSVLDTYTDTHHDGRFTASSAISATDTVLAFTAGGDPIKIAQSVIDTRNDSRYDKAMSSAAQKFRRERTRSTKYGFWGEVVYVDTLKITIKRKWCNGELWIGMILNDGTYIEKTDASIAIDYTSWGSLDGIGTPVTRGQYILYGYENSGGALAFDLSLQPYTTFSNANPTNSLTLNTVEGANIGYLFPVGAELVLWQDSDEWETPWAWQNAGAITISKDKGKPAVSSRTDTTLTLGANLENNNFTASSAVYQVAGFKPLAYDDGLIADAIGARGYADTGIRILMSADASAVIMPFVCDGMAYYVSNGSGSATVTAWNNTIREAITISGSALGTFTRYRFPTLGPVDKIIIYTAGRDSGYDLGEAYYYEAYGNMILEEDASHGGMGSHPSKAMHGISAFSNNGGDCTVNFMGYYI